MDVKQTVSSLKVIYTSPKRPSSPNAIAFDLDETIGNFSEFHLVWKRLEPDMKTQEVFDCIMDLYPEFLRVGISSVLSYLRGKRESGHCLPIYIYTNNQCEDERWIDKIIHYLEKMVGTKHALFAKPIRAFKIKNRRVEPNRTTHEKTYSDFIQCSMLNIENLCFIDDSYYSKMKCCKVYYIQPPSYFHTLTRAQVIDRFLMSDIYKRLYPDNSVAKLSSHDFVSIDVLNYEKEFAITNKIMFYIREFFFICSKKNNTKKRKPLGTCKFSRKRRHFS